MVDGQLIPMEKEEFQKTVPLAIRDWKKGEPS
jgi:hypothetical protein